MKFKYIVVYMGPAPGIVSKILITFRPIFLIKIYFYVKTIFIQIQNLYNTMMEKLFILSKIIY